MKPASERLLNKADRALRAARLLKDSGEADFSIARSYYAMFYAAEAALFERGLSFRKHSAVHSAFGEHLVKSGALESQLHRWLLDAFDLRIQGDYGIDAFLEDAQAGEALERAEEFVRRIRALLS